MALSDASFVHYKSAITVADFTTSPIGGAQSITVITGTVLSEVLFMMASTAAAQTQYAKTFWANTDGVASAYAMKLWLPNALDDYAGSAGHAAFQSDAAGDNTAVYGKAIGSLAGTPIQENVTLNATTQVQGVLNFDTLSRCEIRAVAGNNLTPAVGNIGCYLGTATPTLLGYVPAPDTNNSWRTATGEIEVWLEAALDGATTVTNALTAPAGSSFTKPRTQATGITCANGGTLGPSHGQAIWWRWNLAASALPSDDIETGFRYYCRTAA